MTTSSDGFLTATADLATASVLLSVNYASAAPVPAVNLLANPNSESLVALTQVSNNTSSRSTTFARTGSASTRMSSTASGNMTSRTNVADRAPVSPGQAYVAQAWVRAGSSTRSMKIDIEWFTAAGASISASTGSATTNTTAFAQRTAAGTAPATAAFAGILVTVTSTGAASELHYVDDMQIERGGSATTYLDGSVAGSAWTGTANASISYRPQYRWVTVKRADGTAVRGADMVLAPNGVHSKLIDHEAPLGVAVVYTATFSNGIASVTSTTATATITGQTAVTWLKSLRYPALSVVIDVASAPDWSSDIALTVLYPISSGYPSASYGVRQAKTGTLSVNTYTRAELDELEALAASDGPYLIQFASNSEEPPRFAAIGNIQVNWDVDVATTKERTVVLGLTEVARPATAGTRVAYPGHTYGDSTATWPLYSNRTGTYASR